MSCLIYYKVWDRYHHNMSFGLWHISSYGLIYSGNFRGFILRCEVHMGKGPHGLDSYHSTYGIRKSYYEVTYNSQTMEVFLSIHILLGRFHLWSIISKYLLLLCSIGNSFTIARSPWYSCHAYGFDVFSTCQLSLALFGERSFYIHVCIFILRFSNSL